MFTDKNKTVEESKRFEIECLQYKHGLYIRPSL